MKEIEAASSIIRQGGIVIFPTDTVFALGCRVGNHEATKRLYAVKQRPDNQPTLILAESLEQATKYGIFEKAALALATKFWPGPLTIVVKAKNEAAKYILGPGHTLAIRVPKFNPVQEILKQVGDPILAPSANFRGKQATAKLGEIDKNLTKLVDYVLEMECGGKKPSTIVDVSGKTHRILREGSVSKKEISNLLTKGD
ncbi:MAG: L-threonylcarbamoyladenylate synthase [Candidatus Woykebacteria bacterium]